MIGGEKSMGAVSVGEKPSFTADQIVNATDIQRRWKAEIEGKLSDLPYLVLMAGKAPRVVIMEYDKFENLWQKLEALGKDLLEMEAMNRVLAASISGKKLSSLKEVMAKVGITQEELDKLPDVKLEDE